MNTAAPHALKKRLLTLALSLAFLLTCLPAALAVDLNVDAGFYFKQSRGGTCTLASAAMMLRRRAYFDGLSDWTNVTENSVRSTAWANGLAHSFTYKEMQVGYATLPSGLQSKTAVLISLLEQHPEGIVLYDRTQPHAVLLTDYTNGIFYCSDPAGNIGYGRIPHYQLQRVHCKSVLLLVRHCRSQQRGGTGRWSAAGGRALPGEYPHRQRHGADRYG